MADLDSRITVPPRVLFRDLGEEAVILELENGKYYGLNDVGTRMWALLQQHRRVEPVLRILAEEYDVDEERLRRELLGLIDALVSRHLLEIDET